MIGWFQGWLERFVQLGIRLAGALLAGVLGGLMGGATRGAVIRRARPEEVLDVRHVVLRAGKARETAIFDGDDAPSTRHWVSELDGRVVGVVTVIEAAMPESPVSPAPRWQLRGMGVLEELRGRHLGEALLLEAHRDVAEPMWCNARLAVVPFYERSGWEATGPVFDVPGIGPHRRMLFLR